MPSQPIGDYKHAPAVCRPYDPRAPEVAGRISGMIRERVPGAVVEHVGSTAVPGCAGKGVIDLLSPYQRGGLEPLKRALDDLGFRRQSTRHPFSEDRPMRVGSAEHDGNTFRLHVHIVPADSGEPEELRAFRDRLRSDPAMLRAYVKRKRQIIREGTTDSTEYALVKGSFVREALDGMRR